jgi:hypothetical protein
LESKTKAFKFTGWLFKTRSVFKRGGGGKHVEDLEEVENKKGRNPFFKDKNGGLLTKKDLKKKKKEKLVSQES